ncbi:AfsR/SARP family transcriptional regulator [Modestobacter marinus]|uniref:AfsR/SARP family transcriptional regulator n=1 Tax=Modestobacter marinus TaxID=477641 RepID=UPI001C983F56|nr:BTAD domain-containing putative transcriptional regulator [Modestobacter marinus]
MGTAAARVDLMGGFALYLTGSRSCAAVDDLPRGVQRLVAHLGLSHRPARAAVAGLLWPDVPESQAHGSLRSALWRLQKVAPGLVDVSGGALALAPAVRVDVREFDVWAHSALDPRGDADPVISAGVGMSGDLLPGWYDDWVLLERERLRQLRLHALEALADKLTAAGRHGEAVQAAHAAVRTEPLRETAHRTLMRIHLAQGNVAEAIRTCESFRALLFDELGVAPSPQMEELVFGLRRSPSSRAPARVPGGALSEGPRHRPAHRGPARVGGPQ